MSIIVPAGKHAVSWVPSEKKMTRSAQTETGGDLVEEADSRDALYDAAKGVVEAMDAEQGDVVETEVNAEDEGVVGEVTDVTEVGESDDAGEVTEECEEAAVDAVEKAVEAVEVAVEDLKEVVQNEEIAEVSDDEEIEIEIEVDDKDEEPVDDDGGELIVESVPSEVEGCGSLAETEEAGMDKSASSEEFCKFAKLSPQNRKKVAYYWKNSLGYPADYVALMVKDYEK